MSLKGKKLGVLISAGLSEVNFDHACHLAQAAHAEGLEVYVYCIDEAVAGLSDSRLQALRAGGVRLFGCAFGAQKRQVAISDHATFAGLALLSELIANVDRFLAFN